MRQPEKQSADQKDKRYKMRDIFTINVCDLKISCISHLISENYVLAIDNHVTM